MPVTHTYVSPAAPTADPALVGSQHWNAGHTVSIVNADVNPAAGIVESKLALNFPTHAPVTIGAPANGLSILGQVVSLGLASSGVTGALSGLDWDTFNNKQAALSFPLAANLGGTGVANAVGSTLTLGGAVTISTGGTIALGGFTLTIPATGTAALLAVANVFTAVQKINVNSLTAFLVEQDGVKDNVLLVDTTNGRVGFGAPPNDLADLYSGQLRFTPVTAPAAPTVALAGLGGGNVDNGTHRYVVTFVKSGGEETEFSTFASVVVVDKTTDGQVAVTNIPVSTEQDVAKRKIYRTKIASLNSYYLLTTINDNSSTSYPDNTADAGLGVDVIVLQRDNNTAGRIKIGSNTVFFAATNTQIGKSALAALTTGQDNVAVGGSALAALTTGFQNVAVGAGTLQNVTTASQSVAIGYQAGNQETTGIINSNVYIGYQCGFRNQTGTGNVYVGYQAGFGLGGNYTGSNNNVAVGYSALASIQSNAGGNVAIGYRAGITLTTGDNNVFIGFGAGRRQTTGNNVLLINNQEFADAATELTNSILYGVMGATPSVQTLTINAVGKVAVNTTTVNAVLNVFDLTAYVSTAATGFSNGGGVGLTFTAETATDGTNQLQALIASSWIDSTNATRKAKLSLSAYDTAVRLGMEIEASGTAAKLAFYGGTTVIRGAALTAADAGVVNSGDATTDGVINNMRIRINELEARLGSATGVNLFA